MTRHELDELLPPLGLPGVGGAAWVRGTYYYCGRIACALLWCAQSSCWRLARALCVRGWASSSRLSAHAEARGRAAHVRRCLRHAETIARRASCQRLRPMPSPNEQDVPRRVRPTVTHNGIVKDLVRCARSGRCHCRQERSGWHERVRRTVTAGSSDAARATLRAEQLLVDCADRAYGHGQTAQKSVNLFLTAAAVAHVLRTRSRRRSRHSNRCGVSHTVQQWSIPTHGEEVLLVRTSDVKLRLTAAAGLTAGHCVARRGVRETMVWWHRPAPDERATKTGQCQRLREWRTIGCALVGLHGAEEPATCAIVRHTRRGRPAALP